MDLNGVFAEVAKKMLLKYTKYWGNISRMNQLIYFGVIFDPRYKLRFVEWNFNDMFGNGSDTNTKLLESITKNLSIMFNSYKQTYDNRNTSRDSVSSAAAVVAHGETAASAETTTHLARENAFQQHLKDMDSIEVETELDSYINAKCIPFVEKFDILTWWKENASRYPVLSQIVRDIMPTPVSTVASESAFSTGGRVIEVYRSSLKPEMAEALICAQNWLRPSFYQFKDMEFDEEYEITEEAVTGILARSAEGGPPPSSQTQSQPPGCV